MGVASEASERTGSKDDGLIAVQMLAQTLVQENATGMALARKVAAWVRGHIELSVVGSAMTALVTFVGGRFYDAYYGFFLLDSEYIPVSFRQALTVCLPTAGLSLAMLYAIYGSRAPRVSTFWESLRGNLPLLVILGLLTVCAIDLYMRNVADIAAYIQGQGIGGLSAAQLQHVVDLVKHFLRLAIVVAPLPVAMAIIVVASTQRLSLSAYLTKGSFVRRAGFFMGYMVLVGVSLGIFGRTFALLEYFGARENPRIQIYLSDGSEYLAQQKLFLLAQDDKSWIVTAVATTGSMDVRSWYISRSAVRGIQFTEQPASASKLFNYLER